MVNVVLPLALAGSCALIWVLETNNSGTRVPLATMQDWPSAVGRGICEVATLVADIFVP